MKETLDQDFREFLSTSEKVPAVLIAQLQKEIARKLNPSPMHIITKLIGIHAMCTLFTLTLCDEFGIRLFAEGPGLMKYFMPLGERGCMICCGAIFLSLSFLAAVLFFNQDELRSMGRSIVFYSVGLVMISLAFFFSFHPREVLDVAAWWSIGAFIGAFLTFEIGWRLKASIT